MEESLKQSLKLTATSIFLINFTIWIIINFVNNMTLLSTYINNSVFIVIRLVVIVGLISTEFLDFTVNLKLLFGYVFILLSLYIGYRNNYTILFDTALLIVTSRHVKFSSILKCFFISSVSMAMFTILLAKIGFIDNRVYYQLGRIRASLGFGYATFLPQLFFFCSLVYIQLRKKMLTFIEVLVIVILDIYLYRISDTRNPFVLTLVLVVLTMLINRSSRFEQLFIKISPLFTPIFLVTALFSYYFSKNYGNNGFSIIVNNLLSGRLGLGQNAILQYGIHPLGQKIDLFGGAAIRYGNISYLNDYNYIDSSYLQSLILYGTIFSMFVLVLLTFVMIILVEKKQVYLVLSMLLIAIHSMIDPQLIMLWYSPFLLLIGYLFSSETNTNLVT